jgi:hypothetical protein
MIESLGRTDLSGQVPPRENGSCCIFTSSKPTHRLRPVALLLYTCSKLADSILLLSLDLTLQRQSTRYIVRRGEHTLNLPLYMGGQSRNCGVCTSLPLGCRHNVASACSQVNGVTGRPRRLAERFHSAPPSSEGCNTKVRAHRPLHAVRIATLYLA